MKKKIVNIIFNVPLLLLGVTFLALQGYFIGIILLVIACITFYYITTSDDMNINKRIRNIIIAYVTIFIVYTIINFAIDSIYNYKEKKIFEEDISKCYSILNEEHNYNKFENLMEKHSYDFKKQAYIILEKIVDDKIEQAKAENIDTEFIDMLSQVNITDNYYMSYEMSEGLEKKIELLKGYNELVKVSNSINNKDYIEANNLLATLNSNTDNEDIKEKITAKQEEIKDVLYEQVIAKAQELINKKDYTSAQTLLENYKDLGNKTILDMYNNATNEVNRIEAEKKAKEEAERKAREKKEAEEEAKRIAEEKARKKREGVRIGMTKQDVLDSSWGKPNYINKTTTKYGVHEQWVYGGGNYLYFDDGILTAIQD